MGRGRPAGGERGGGREPTGRAGVDEDFAPVAGLLRGADHDVVVAVPFTSAKARVAPKRVVFASPVSVVAGVERAPGPEQKHGGIIQLESILEAKEKEGLRSTAAPRASHACSMNSTFRPARTLLLTFMFSPFTVDPRGAGSVAGQGGGLRPREFCSADYEKPILSGGRS